MDTLPDQNAASGEIDKILAKAVRVLGSLEAPNYSRVKLDMARYVRIVVELSANFWIRDVTDVNTDASSVLLLRPNCSISSEECLLYVSNIGDYAFATAVDKALAASSSPLEELLSSLKRCGLENLSKDILSVPVKAMTFNSDRPRLFNILFSDSEYLPWESADYDPDETAANDA